MLFRRNKWQMHFLWRPERQRHPIFSLLVFIALWCGSVGVHLRCKSWNAVNEILVTFYACIYKMFQFLQHCLLVVSSVIEHLFYPKNGQALQGLLIHFLKCWFAGDLCNFRLADLGLQTAFLTQTLFECFEIWGLFLGRKGDVWELSGIQFELHSSNHSCIDYSGTSFWIWIDTERLTFQNQLGI